MYRYPNYLCHYGVLGMKWGQRKARNSGSKSTQSSSRNNTENKEARNKKVKTALKVAASVGVSVAAGYATKKYTDMLLSKEYERAYQRGMAFMRTVNTSDRIRQIEKYGRVLY